METAFRRKAPLPAPSRKAFGARLGVVPAGSPRRLCQPPWTQPPATERTLFSGRIKPAETVPAERQHPPGNRLVQYTALHPAASPRRCCQQPQIQPPATEDEQLSGGTKSAETAPAERQPLFGREREGGASLREAASLASSPHIIMFTFSSGDSGARYSRCTRGWCGRRRIRRTSPCW